MTELLVQGTGIEPHRINSDGMYTQSTFAPNGVIMYTPGVPLTCGPAPFPFLPFPSFPLQDIPIYSTSPFNFLSLHGVDQFTFPPLNNTQVICTSNEQKDLAVEFGKHDTTNNINNSADDLLYNSKDSTSDSDSVSISDNMDTPKNDTSSEKGRKRSKRRNKKEGESPCKRGRKPTQDPPYTKLYKQPWLDGWATCKRLALEYVQETIQGAESANLPLDGLKRLLSQSDLTNGTSKRSWTPMELVLAREFLKQADLIDTSTKGGAVIKNDIQIKHLPDLIEASVLPSTDAAHQERKKELNEAKKEKKTGRKRKQKLDSPPLSPLSLLPLPPSVLLPPCDPSELLSPPPYFFQSDPIAFLPCE